MICLTSYAARKYKQHQAEKRQMQLTFSNVNVNDHKNLNEKVDSTYYSDNQQQTLTSSTGPDVLPTTLRLACTGHCNQPQCNPSCTPSCCHQRKCMKKCQGIGCCERKRLIHQQALGAEGYYQPTTRHCGGAGGRNGGGCCGRKRRAREEAAAAAAAITAVQQEGSERLTVAAASRNGRNPVQYDGKVGEVKEKELVKGEHADELSNSEEKEEFVEVYAPHYVQPPPYDHKA